ncbi:MAG: TonB-dependent receptor [Bacteroides sp.]|uniref:TonB-dependent receptor n=1 Tax=Bacteroides sp. TaxID=29523 RepID=UPI002FCACAF1
MKQKVLFSLLILMLMSISVSAQTGGGRIAGVVIDNTGEDPLPGATLFIEELKKGGVADKHGEFSFPDIPFGTYSLTVKFVGYQTSVQTITVSKESVKKAIIRLKAEVKSLDEVVVMGKSEARKIREQAMPVSVISMKQLQGTVSDVQGILAKTVGVAIRSSGGVGSTSRLSVRGLEGKRIGFFIDETPLNDQSDFIDLNDIPIDMIDRIEIYKGVVPAKFGGSSMGGAVNIVIKEYPDRYADLSYTRESFNVNKAQTVFKRNLKDAGLVFGIGGGYTYADNDYTMESPYVKGLKIKRNHDNFRKILVGGSLKAKNWWFDEVEFEPVFIDTYKEIQGIETDIRKAHTRSRLYMLANKLEKDNFLLEGLDLDMSTAIGYTQYGLVDTAKVWYDWSGISYPTPSLHGGELGTRYASESDNKKATFMNKLSLEYLIDKHHSVSFNSVFTLANGYPSDPTKEKSLGKKTDFDSRMRSWTVGLTYDYRTKNDKFLNSLTSRYYWYSMNTSYQNIYVNIPVEDINLNKNSIGFSNAMRYRFTPSFMGKLSGGYDVRIPSENELLGDGYTISPSERLLPERNLSANAGVLYDVTGIHPSNLQIELSGYYMYLQDMIRFTKGIFGAQYQNFGEMRTLGVEFEVKADIFPFLYTYGNVTYQDLRDVRSHEEGSNIPNATKGKRMPNIPYFMANAGLEFHKENLFGGKGQNTRLFVDLAFVEEYLYDFEITENAKRRIPRSTTIDLGFEYSFMNQRLFISGKIKNLTSSTILSEFNRPLPGRSFGVKLRYVFR